MQINKEPNENHSIQSYSDTRIKVNNEFYEKSIIICRDMIIPDWDVGSLTALDEKTIAPLLKTEPEVIIIGHNQPNSHPPVKLLADLSHQRIGLECMSIGAACRTFNVLLGENRKVTLGIIFQRPKDAPEPV